MKTKKHTTTSKPNTHSSITRPKKTKRLNGLKVVLKSIYDVKELYKSEEYNYSYDLIYFKLLCQSINIINNEIVILPYKFVGNTLYNENINILRNYYYDKFIKIDIIEGIKKIFSNLEINDKLYNTKLIGELNNKIITNLLNNKKNVLVITASYYDININFNKNIKLLLLQNQINNPVIQINLFKNKFSNTIDGQNNEKLIKYFDNNNDKYSTIFIDFLNINYNFLADDLVPVIKLPLIIYVLFNALKKLDYNNRKCELYIKIANSINYLPIMTKIFCILINLFEDVEILYPDLNLNNKFIKFSKFRNFNNIYNETLINNIIKIGEENLNNVFDTDDFIDILISNKFFYNIDNKLVKKLKEQLNKHINDESNDESNDKTKSNKIKHKILYDIPELNFSAVDMNEGYKFINKMNNITNKYNYIKNYFNNKYIINKSSILEFFQYLYINYYYFIENYNIVININTQKILENIFSNYVQKISAPISTKYGINISTKLITYYSSISNKLNIISKLKYSGKSSKRLKSQFPIENAGNINVISKDINEIDPIGNYEYNIYYKMYYYQLLLLKNIDCDIINKISNKINNTLSNYISQDSKLSIETIALYEILNVFKSDFSKNIVNTLIINYHIIDDNILKAFNSKYPWFLVNIQKPNYISSKQTEYEKDFQHNIRYIDDISITNTLNLLKDYKTLGYTLIYPHININICNEQEYYKQELLQLLYILGSSNRYSNSISQHTIIIDDIFNINDSRMINCLIDIIYIYSLLYKNIKLYKPHNLNHNTTFYLIGLDFQLNNTESNRDIIDSVITNIIYLLNNPNNDYKILENISNDVQTKLQNEIKSEIISNLVEILKKCNEWRFIAYKLCMCKNINSINCYKLLSDIKVNAPEYFIKPLKGF